MPGRKVRSGMGGILFCSNRLSILLAMLLFVDLMVGTSGVEFAVRILVFHVLATEVEICTEWVADRPLASVFVKLIERETLFNWDKELWQLRCRTHLSLEAFRYFGRSCNCDSGGAV